MVNKDEELQDTPIAKEPVNQVNVSSPSCSKKKYFILLLGILSVGAVGLSVYSLCQINRLHTKQVEVNKLLTIFQNQQANRVNKLSEEFYQVQEKTTSHLKELKADFNTALHQQSYNNDDWMLQKVRHFLELAKIEEHWGNNNTATIALLTQADNLIKNINNPSRFFSTRQAIAREITELKAQKKLDVTGILSQLDAAENLVNQLPIAQMVTFPSMPANQGTTWREHLKENLKILKKLVIIRKNNGEENLIISPLHEALLKDSLRINLEKAQWAIINNNSTIYQQSLQQSLAIIIRAFDSTSSVTKTLEQQIKELQQVSFTKSLPVIKQSLDELESAIKTNSAPTNSQTEGE